MKRSVKTTTRVLTAGALAATALAVCGSEAASAGSGTPAGKTVYVIATRTFGKTAGPVQLAGGIGDYGKGEYATSSGSPSSSGNYYLTVLKHGHVIINLTQLNKRLQAANPSEYNPQTCSGVIKVSATAAITGGTGAYKGADGTLVVSTVSEFVVPRFTSGAKAGQCNINTRPAHAFTLFSAKGKVTT